MRFGNVRGANNSTTDHGGYLKGEEHVRDQVSPSILIRCRQTEAKQTDDASDELQERNRREAELGFKHSLIEPRQEACEGILNHATEDEGCD